jgi:AcrR family transcriptional regulator
MPSTSSPPARRPGGRASGRTSGRTVDDDPTPVTDDEVVAAREDGRHARRDRNKYAVVDAYLALVRQGNARPSIADVAERSGVSHRSVFRYFADKDELARTAIERQYAVAMPLAPLTVTTAASLDERIDGFVERRLELFDAIAPIARLSRSLAGAQPLVANELRTSREFFRSQIRHLFAAEIERRTSPEREYTIATLDALCSFEAADLMLLDQGRSPADTAAALRWALRRLLTD